MLKIILALHEQEILDFNQPTQILTAGKERRDIYLTGVLPEGGSRVLRPYPYTHP